MAAQAPAAFSASCSALTCSRKNFLPASMSAWVHFPAPFFIVCLRVVMQPGRGEKPLVRTHLFQRLTDCTRGHKQPGILSLCVCNLCLEKKSKPVPGVVEVRFSQQASVPPRPRVQHQLHHGVRVVRVCTLKLQRWQWRTTAGAGRTRRHWLSQCWAGGLIQPDIRGLPGAPGVSPVRPLAYAGAHA